MTNTNDFRKYSFASDTSYIINSFDFERSSAARKRAPEAEPVAERGFRVITNSKRKPKTVLKAEERASRRLAAVVVAVSLICAVMVGMVINSFVVKNELTKNITAIQTNIANAQSEHISLQAQLDGLVSISMIDEYAVSKLGMTKVKSNQIQYMDVSEYKAKRMEAINSKTLPEKTKSLTKLASNN